MIVCLFVCLYLSITSNLWTVVLYRIIYKNRINRWFIKTSCPAVIGRTGTGASGYHGKTMYLTSNVSSNYDEDVWTELGNSTWLRHLFTSLAVSNLKFVLINACFPSRVPNVLWAIHSSLSFFSLSNNYDFIDQNFSDISMVLKLYGNRCALKEQSLLFDLFKALNYIESS